MKTTTEFLTLLLTVEEDEALKLTAKNNNRSAEAQVRQIIADKKEVNHSDFAGRYNRIIQKNIHLTADAKWQVRAGACREHRSMSEYIRVRIPGLDCSVGNHTQRLIGTNK